MSLHQASAYPLPTASACISICIHGTRHGVLMVVWGHGSTVDVICWPVVHRSYHGHKLIPINIDGMSTYVPTTGQAKRWRRAHGECHPWNHTICGLYHTKGPGNTQPNDEQRHRWTPPCPAGGKCMHATAFY